MKKMPILFTFDVDGETLWLNRDPDNINRPVTLSLGQYGPREGLPRILRILKKYDVPATFFVPGKTAEDFPDVVYSINEAGHDIGNHSYSHKWPDRYTKREEEEEDYAHGAAVIEPMIGKKLVGYRSPAWEFSKFTLGILKQMGIEYSANMMGTDKLEYLEIFGEKSDIVEIPCSWETDDAAFWLYSVRIQGKAMQPLESVEKCWKDEFDVLYEDFLREVEEKGDSDIVFCLTCHPQIIGRPSRSRVLENLIKHIKQYPNVEFMKASKAVADFKAKHK